MKPIMEGWRGHLTEAPKRGTKCDEETKPKEAGKRFEYVVVYQARRMAGAPALSSYGPKIPVACVATWVDQPYPTKKSTTTLGDLADEAIDLALKSGAITKDDLKQANMQTIGKQVPTGGNRRIEIKTDIVFGQKNISVKLSGDVQGQTNEAASTALQISEVFAEVFEKWKETEKEVAEDTLAKFKRDLSDVKKKMERVGKEVRLTPGRIKTLIDKDLQSPDPKKRAAAVKRYQALINNYYIDAEGKILIQALDQSLWAKNHTKNLTREINNLLDSDEDFRRAFTDEVLTGRRMFRNSPGAIAEYILSPDHFFVLDPDVDGYEESINLFSKIMKLGIRPKSGRTILPGVSIGVKPAYRFDIKKKQIENEIAASIQLIKRKKLQVP